MSASSSAEPSPAASQPLSLAVIRARYNPYGGAERFVQRALTALSGRSLALTIVARDWRSGTLAARAGSAEPGGAGSAADGLPADVHLARVDPFYVGNVWRDASFAHAVQRHLRNTSYRLVQSHERIPGVMLYRAGDGVHAEFLAQRRRVLGRAGRLGLVLNPYHRYTLRAERAMFEHPRLRAVICNSDMVRQEIVGHFAIDPAKLVLIRNGVDLQRFAPADTAGRQRARRDLRVDGNAALLAFVGSGFERKGLPAAMQALAGPQVPGNTRLMVAGRDKHVSRYRAMARHLGLENRVSFLGGMDDVRPLLHAADGLLMPTLYDPFPNAVLEALACGVPAITSTKSGAAEVIEHGRGGFVTDALDIDAISAAVSQLAAATADPPLGSAMRAAARAGVQQHSMAALADDLLALYEKLLTE